MHMAEHVVYKERTGTNCEKWDALEDMFGASDLIPMWVADMDFQAPECVRKSLQEYVEYGVFGYYHIPATYTEAFIRWEKENHGYEVKPEWIKFAPGVVPAFNWWVRIFTDPGDAVIIQQPVYYPFSHAIKNNSRKLVISHLLNENGIYTVDYKDFEEKIVEHDVKLFILCSPHNPVGRVWTPEELKRMLDICRRHGVKVISDEIHHDIIIGDRPHTPAATLGDYDDMLVTLISSTKTFNLAGCQNSFVIVPDEKLRKQYDQFTSEIRIHSGNAFGYIAAESAFTGGRPWLDEVIAIIRDNFTYLSNTLTAEFPGIEVSPLEATYLCWVNLGAYVPADQIKEVVQDKAGIAVDYGNWFGGSRYDQFIRFNLATSEEQVKKAVSQLLEALQSYK